MSLMHFYVIIVMVVELGLNVIQSKASLLVGFISWARPSSRLYHVDFFNTNLAYFSRISLVPVVKCECLVQEAWVSAVDG